MQDVFENLKPLIIKSIATTAILATPFWAFAEEACSEGYQPIPVAWSIGKSDYTRMMKDASLGRNKSVDHEEKVERVMAHMDRIRAGLKSINVPVSDRALADMIIKVADCTGNDYSIFAALLGKESYYCADRHNNSGGDSGCGQFTTPAITEIKNQMRLPGAKNHGTDYGKKGFDDLLARCDAASRAEQKEAFKDLFSDPVKSIKTFLRGGHDIETDLIATAIYLKFNYGLSGFYYDPGKKAQGALSRYNGGGTAGYAKSVNNSAIKVKSCIERDQEAAEVGAEACALSGDMFLCDQMDGETVLL